MLYVKIEADESGARATQNTTGKNIPEGFIAIDETYNSIAPWIKLEFDENGDLINISENTVAKEAWLAQHQEEEPQEVISESDIALDMLADHEYRLCLMELGG